MVRIMGTPMKLATYALALVVVFIVALEVGFRVRPVVGATAQPPTATAPAGHTEETGHGPDGHGTAEQADPGETAADQPAGLSSTEDGYRLSVLTPRPAAGPATPLRLLISGPDGAPVTAYDLAHGKQLHLIVVRRDLNRFQHVHPVLDRATGVWSTTIDTSQAGTYRVYADVVPTGHDNLILGTDIAVAGRFAPEPPATREVRVAEVDGYRVELRGDLHAGQVDTLTATVSRGGRPINDLDAYLEAYGHLVALRQSDLAYLHVHPDGHPGDGRTTAGPAIDFAVDAPTAGTYRLFLDFSHGGVVRTAPFVVRPPDRHRAAGQDRHRDHRSDGRLRGAGRRR